jgi:hypothetical protein
LKKSNNISVPSRLSFPAGGWRSNLLSVEHFLEMGGQASYGTACGKVVSLLHN